jgi:ribonuclease BN (tRNA processing enzyme)
LKVILQPSAFGDAGDAQYATSFVVNDVVAIDAGTLGYVGEPAHQSRIGHVFLTHSHCDHVASLPAFVENVFQLQAAPVAVYGSRDTLDSLRRDLFNDRLCPDFLGLSKPGREFLRVVELQPEVPVDCAGLRLTPIKVDHTVSTFAFLIEDGSAAIAIVTDTRPTPRVWEILSACKSLRGVFLECAFPDEMQELADLSGHLTPRQFALELSNLPQNLPVFAIHLKARYRRQITHQLHSIGLPKVGVAQAGRDYIF